MLETGHYQIVAEGHGLPSRYPPWFSTVVILAFLVLGRWLFNRACDAVPTGFSGNAAAVRIGSTGAVAIWSRPRAQRGLAGSNVHCSGN